MQARGALMIEHRLIERAIHSMEAAIANIEAMHEVDPVFIQTIVDFISTYADRTHHGKEEDILFRKLDKKKLTADDRSLMEKLLEDHRLGRSATRALADAGTRYADGDARALDDISKNLATLVALYPQHIEIEDKIFFPHSRNYLTDAEDQTMLAEFMEFDRKMIHEKYRRVIEQMQTSPPTPLLS